MTLVRFSFRSFLRCNRLVRTIAILSIGALAPQTSLVAQAIPPSEGELAWQAGHDAALRGQADLALKQYNRAWELAREERDNELASAARLGMAEVWDVWKRCRDSARVSYEEAVNLSSEFDYSAADAYVLWLARLGDHESARALHARTYSPIENEVPRTITRESVNFLLGIAAIQIANSSRSGAHYSLLSARDIASRLETGDEIDPSELRAVRPSNYWVLHDLAALYLDPASKGVRNVAAGNALRKQLDDARDVSDNGGQPRFSVGRLADRVARERRLCKTASCKLPPPPPAPRCR